MRTRVRQPIAHGTQIYESFPAPGTQRVGVDAVVTGPVYEIVLAPKEGDGFLTAADVAASVAALPPGSRVLVRFEFCEDYEPAAPGVLARHLTGCVVEHYFGHAAWRVAEWWSETYEREAAAYLTVEADRLARGA